eukprot:IDg19417t1
MKRSSRNSVCTYYGPLNVLSIWSCRSAGRAGELVLRCIESGDVDGE